MLYMTLQEITKVCAGACTFSSASEADTPVIGGVTDNRKVESGNLFFAIKGERVDGHRFAQQAIEAGASAVIAERPLPEVTGPVIVVESTTKALSQIAAAYRARFTIPVVGITGSVGKTSTKEMIASILSQKYNVLKTDGNFNNEIGMPLTLLRVREEHEVAVVEMGINHFGEMDRMSRVARPDLFVITNIGECHLEFLGDRDGVLRAKTEGFTHMKPGTPVVLNGEDDKLITLKDDPRIRPVYYCIDSCYTAEGPSGPSMRAAGNDRSMSSESGVDDMQRVTQSADSDRMPDADLMADPEVVMLSCESAGGFSCADLTNFYMEGMLRSGTDQTDDRRNLPECTVYADTVQSLGEDGTDFTLHAGSDARRVHLAVPGLHMVRNALAGTCIARELGLSMGEIVCGIEEMRTISGRSHFIHTPAGLTIIDDCYNANPTSTKASLDMLADCSGRRIAVLGDMGELGADEVRMHREVGEYAALLGLEAAFFCGPLSRAAAEGMLEAGRTMPRHIDSDAGGFSAGSSMSLNAGEDSSDSVMSRDGSAVCMGRSADPDDSYPVICWFAEKEEMTAELTGFVRPGDTVLVKASHFMGFEEIVEKLKLQRKQGRMRNEERDFR